MSFDQNTTQFVAFLVSFVALIWNPMKQISLVLYERFLTHLPQEQHALIQKAVQLAVQEAEQLSQNGSLDLANRKSYAARAALSVLEHFGVKNTEQLLGVIGTYIESAVFQNHAVMHQPTPPPVTAIPAENPTTVTAGELTSV